jgi:hypothetical protein
MTTENVYIEAFAPLKPLLVEQYTGYVTRTLEHYMADWEAFSAKGRVQMSYDATWRFVRGFAVMSSDRMSAHPTGVNTERLNRLAEQNATAQIESFAHKLVQKLGQFGEFEATFARGGDFTIKGVVNGHKVVVDQQTIFKISSQGTPFNQFPARIYVDGKFTPAAKYAEAVK